MRKQSRLNAALAFQPGDLRKLPHSFPMALHDSASTIAYAVF
jgi:hypothetical protein